MAERIAQQRQAAIGLLPHRPLGAGAGGQGPRYVGASPSKCTMPAELAIQKP